MDKIYDVLKQHIADHQPNFSNGYSVLSLLYEAYSECNRLDETGARSGSCLQRRSNSYKGLGEHSPATR